MCLTIDTPNTPCVIAVAADDALAWTAGRLDDKDLLLRSPLVPEAVFIVNLPDRASYREVLRQVKLWQSKGAVFLIARTGTPCVDRHMDIKNGCIRTFEEPADPTGLVKFRFIAPPGVFKRWVEKWSSKPRPVFKDAPAATLEGCPC